MVQVDLEILLVVQVDLETLLVVQVDLETLLVVQVDIWRPYGPVLCPSDPYAMSMSSMRKHISLTTHHFMMITLAELESSGVSAEGLQSTDQNFSGTNNADSVNKSSSTESWTLSGYSGADSLTGSPQNDVIWGALGNDTLTGLGGSDQFYYMDLLEGKDQITDFTVGQDTFFLLTILFQHIQDLAYIQMELLWRDF